MQYVILVHVVHSCEQLLHVGLDVRRGQYLRSANRPRGVHYMRSMLATSFKDKDKARNILTTSLLAMRPARS